MYARVLSIATTVSLFFVVSDEQYRINPDDLQAVQCGLEAVLASVRALEAHVSAQLSSYPSALKVVMDLATYAYSGDFATAKIPSRVVLERIETEIKESAKSLTAEHSAFLAGLLAKVRWWLAL